MALQTSKEIRAKYKIDEIFNDLESAFYANSERNYKIFCNEGLPWDLAQNMADEKARALPYFLLLDAKAREEVEHNLQFAQKAILDSFIKRLDTILACVEDEHFQCILLNPSIFRIKKYDSLIFFLERQKDLLSVELKYWNKESRAGHQKGLFYALFNVFLTLSKCGYDPRKQRRLVYSLLNEYNYEWKPGLRVRDWDRGKVVRNIRVQIWNHFEKLVKMRYKYKPQIDPKKRPSEQEEYYMDYFDILYHGRPMFHLFPFLNI